MKLLERMGIKRVGVIISEPIRVLPTDIQYNIDYRNGQMTPEDIALLARSDFINEALYLTTKALEPQNPQQTADFLHAVTVDTVTGGGEIKDIIIKTLALVDPISTVKGSKLSNLNRHGFDLYERRFEQIATELVEENGGPSQNPVLIANAALLGLRTFVTEYDRRDRRIFILNPTWIEKGQEIAGFQIRPMGRQTTVQPIVSDFRRPVDYCFVDDIVRTTSHAQVAMNFWTRETNAPLDMNRIRTVVDLTKTGGFPNM